MSEPRPQVPIEINPAAVGGPFQVELQYIRWRVALGLNRAEDATLQDLSLPATPFDVAPANNIQPAIDEVKAEFNRWTISNGLRDCAEACHAHLEVLHTCCLSMKLGAHGPIPSESLPANYDSPRKKFHGFDFPKKLQKLEEDYGVTFNQDGLRCLKTLNKTRNCLSHRGGIIRQEDCGGDPEGFKFEWRVTALLRDDGTEVEFGKPVMSSGISMGIKVRKRLYRLGDRLNFSSRDFAEFVMELFGHPPCPKTLLAE